jgi:malate dehydrogenase (oxaloacetate-decarboxylating)
VLADPNAQLLPSVERVREVSRHVALAVVREAQRSGVTRSMSDAEIVRSVDDKMWEPHYLPYRRAS